MISDAQYALLRAESRRSGLSLAELVRHALRETYGATTQADRRRALEASRGAWHEQGDEDRSAYLSELRPRLDERLARREAR